jgi:hypothetical protein
MPENKRHEFENPQLGLLDWRHKTPEAEAQPPVEEEPARHSEPTIEDVKQYFIDHLHGPGFDDPGTVLKFDPIEWLPFFEKRAEILGKTGSPELYRTRELTYVLDRKKGSGGHIKYKLPEVSNLVRDWAEKRFAMAPKTDSRESLEEKVRRDGVLEPLRTFEHIGKIGIEPVLSIVEERVADLDGEIDRKFTQSPTSIRHRKELQEEIAALKEERKRWRRARICLYGTYFGK